MAYWAVRFDVDALAADAWADALLEVGALSVDLADPEAETAREVPIYGEPGSDPATTWPVTRVTALFADEATLAAALVGAGASIGAAAPAHVVFTVPEQDWVRATQAQFGPIRIDDRLWIIPSWSEVVDPAATNLVLDPGLAFGTGSHPTTRLCLAWLSRTLTARREATVLDYGCGSGILAIAAARLGAAGVTGTDIDPQALLASRDNAQRNAVRAQFVEPDALAPGWAFDIVVANILANPLIVLAPALAHRVAPAGRILLSGVLATQAAEVQDAYRPWFRISTWNEQEGWVALEGTRLG